MSTHSKLNPEVRQDILRTIACRKDPATAEEISAATGMRSRTVNEYLLKMFTSGDVQRMRTEGRGWRYFISAPSTVVKPTQPNPEPVAMAATA